MGSRFEDLGTIAGTGGNDWIKVLYSGLVNAYPSGVDAGAGNDFIQIHLIHPVIHIDGGPGFDICR